MKSSVPVLFRAGLDEEGEAAAAREHFHVTGSRCALPRGCGLVLARYSVLPFYRELEEDLSHRGAHLVNSYQQHRYVADMANWYPDFEDVTPKTWLRVADCPLDHPGSFVLKGETNSRKQLWDTHMRALRRKNVGEVMSRLLDDTLIGDQQIYIREFEAFETFDFGVRGLPVTNEWRWFALCGRVLAGGFYWSNFPEAEPGASTRAEARAFAETVAEAIGMKCPFVVIDVARHADGRWRLVELNDGQMSGLSMTDPHELYSELAGRL